MDDRDVVALWDFGRLDLTEQRLRAAIETATAERRASDAALLRTQIARVYGLRGQFAEATSELDHVSTMDGAEDPVVRVYLDLERGRAHRSNQEPDLATPLFLTAYENAQTAGLMALAADAAHMMALVGEAESQIEWNNRALAIASAATDPHTRRWITSIENNLGWTMHDLGRFEEAYAHWQRALQAAEERGEAERVRVAHWTLARGLRSLGRYDEALAIQQRLAAEGPEDPYVYEELAELRTALGRTEDVAQGS